VSGTLARQEKVYWVPATRRLCLSAMLTLVGGTGEEAREEELRRNRKRGRE